MSDEKLSPKSLAKETSIPADVEDARYREKYRLLKQKYQHIHLGNCKLRNRIYHVKKEIKYLKRMKRILIQRLLSFGDRFTDVSLEIPDNEPGSNVEDQIIDQVAESVINSIPPPAKKRRPEPKKKPNTSVLPEGQPDEEDETMLEYNATKASVSDIIASVISESRAERAAIKGQNQDNSQLLIPKTEIGSSPNRVQSYPSVSELLSPNRSFIPSAPSS